MGAKGESSVGGATAAAAAVDGGEAGWEQLVRESETSSAHAAAEQFACLTRRVDSAQHWTCARRKNARSHWEDYQSQDSGWRRDVEDSQVAAAAYSPEADMETRSEALVIAYSAGSDEERDMDCGEGQPGGSLG